jgi:predicted lipoprotein
MNFNGQTGNACRREVMAKVETAIGNASRKQQKNGKIIIAAIAAAIVGGIALDTRVVPIGSENDLRQQAFSPDAYGVKTFPRIREFVAQNAVEATKIGALALADKAQLAEIHGTRSSTGSIIPVNFEGTVGEGKSGLYTISIEGFPLEIRVRVQTGPAINGTDLRDVPGDIAFGDFKNQIEYQNAASAINRAMKHEVLESIDTANLTGKSIRVTGAFRLINPKNWVITPTEVTVQ